MLNKDRLDYNNSNNKGRKVRIRSVNKSKDTKVFNSIVDSVNFLNTIESSNKSTLIRRITSMTPYHGYICERDSEELYHLRDKALKVSVTNILTSETVIYSSLRKAALSFSPE